VIGPTILSKIASLDANWRGHRVRRHGPDPSAGDSREADGRIITQRRDGFQCHVTGALDGPLIVLLEQDAPTSQTMASSLGKIPMTSVRRLISPLRRSIVECSLVRCSGGNVI
jgi:hypothetical protein